MVDGEVVTDQKEEPAKERGWFGKTVKELLDENVKLKERMFAIEAAVQVLTEQLDIEVEKIQAVNDPEEIEFIWQNMEELTDTVSALRRHNGFSPLAEFSGARERRRKKEAANR